MALPRAIPLALLLVATPLMAGCTVDAADWYNHRGTVHVDLVPLAGGNSTLDQFRSLKVALYGVSVKQAGAINAEEFTFGQTPLVVDFADLARKGERIPLTEFKLSLRAVDVVTVRLEVLEAVDATGESLQICRIGDTVERWPCFFMPDNGAFRYQDKAIPIPRGGTIDVHFPMEVLYATRGSRSQYYLDADPAKVVLEKR